MRSAQRFRWKTWKDACQPSAFGRSEQARSAGRCPGSVLSAQYPAVDPLLDSRILPGARRCDSGCVGLARSISLHRIEYGEIDPSRKPRRCNLSSTVVKWEWAERSSPSSQF